MSILHRALRAAALLTIALGLGRLECIGSLRADELVASPYDIRDLKIASVDPFDMPSATPNYQTSEPFGLDTFPLRNSNLLNKWNSVKSKLPREHRILVHCRTNIATCPPAAKKFLAVINKALTREGLLRIGEINRAINLDIRPVDDMTQYGVVDRWATPLMVFTSNAGDCEDYAIAKYVALRETGIDSADLRLLIVHDRDTNDDHAVVTVRYDGRWLILDNRTLEMRPDANVGEFDPLFIIDDEGVKHLRASTSAPQNSSAQINPAETGSKFSSGWTALPLLL